MPEKPGTEGPKQLVMQEALLAVLRKGFWESIMSVTNIAVRAGVGLPLHDCLSLP